MTARKAARHLTVRNVPADVAKALDAERRRRGASLNATVVNLLRSALRLEPIRPTNGLERYVGGWTEEEHRQFEEATAIFEQIDDEESP